MEAVGAASAIVGLAIPVFQCAKALRDRVKLVRYPPHPLCTLRELIIVLYLCSQVASEKVELLEALAEYERDINLLESLYNGNKELLDQHNLDTDLKEFAVYAWYSIPFATSLTMRRIIENLDNWLNSINPNLGKKKLPGLRELWKSGDLHEKLVATNAKISNIQRRWQVPRVFKVRKRTVLTTIMARCVCKSVHSYLRQMSLSNLGEWTLLRLKRQLCSNRCSPYSCKVRYHKALTVPQRTRKPIRRKLNQRKPNCRKLNPLAPVARRRGWVSIHPCGYILMDIFLR